MESNRREGGRSRRGRGKTGSLRRGSLLRTPRPRSLGLRARGAAGAAMESSRREGRRSWRGEAGGGGGRERRKRACWKWVCRQQRGSGCLGCLWLQVRRPACKITPRDETRRLVRFIWPHLAEMTYFQPSSKNSPAKPKTLIPGVTGCLLSSSRAKAEGVQRSCPPSPPPAMTQLRPSYAAARIQTYPVRPSSYHGHTQGSKGSKPPK